MSKALPTSSVQSLSCIRRFVTPWTAAHQASLSISNSCPLSWWYHPTISPSVVPFSSHLQSFPASGSFQMSQFFALGGQSSGALSVLPMNTQGWFPLGLTGLISLQSKGLSRVFSNTTVWKHQLFGTVFFMVQLSHLYFTTVKTTSLTIQTFVGKVISLFFNMLSGFVITFQWTSIL